MRSMIHDITTAIELSQYTVNDTESMSVPDFPFFFSFSLRASETVREYLQSFSTPGQRLFYYEPTHMLVLLLV